MKITYLLKRFFMKIIPIKKNRIVFTSFNGHYSDSPKYICEEIHKINPNLDIIWLVEEKYKKDIPSYAKAVEINSRKAWHYYASAHIIIDNVYGGKENNLKQKGFIPEFKYKLFNFLNYKRNQFVYTTWHGMPIKKMGRDQINMGEIYDFSCPNTTMIVNGKHTYDILNHINFEKINMKLLGMPRNDILFNKNIDFINKMKEKLSLPRNKKIIMFAPTFRSAGDVFLKNVERSGLNQLKEIDFDKLFETLNKKFGGEWIFLCRFHYHVEKMVDWAELKNKYGEKIQNGNKYDDMMEYLVCTDILMSDISSSMYDFFITKRPIISLFPDLDNYKDAERGLYIPISDFPFKLNRNFEELLKCIERFDEANYLNKVEYFEKKYGCMNKENSSQIVAEFILKERNLI